MRYKYILSSLLGALLLSSVSFGQALDSNLKPFFGIYTGNLNSFLVGLTSDRLELAIGASSFSNDSSSKTSLSQFVFSAQSKSKIGTGEFFTWGFGTTILPSGKSSGTDINSGYSFAVSVGFQKELSDHFVLDARAFPIQLTSIKFESTTVQSTSIFNSASLGVSYLF